MSLTKPQIQAFRKLAQLIKPVVLIGNKGLTAAVQTEIDHALSTHELIKIHIAGAERTQLLQVATEIAAVQGAHVIQLIGKNVVIYREKPPAPPKPVSAPPRRRKQMIAARRAKPRADEETRSTRTRPSRAKTNARSADKRTRSRSSESKTNRNKKSTRSRSTTSPSKPSHQRPARTKVRASGRNKKK